VTRPRFRDGEWDRLLEQLHRTDALALDDGTADRLVTGSLAADDAPPAHRATVHAVAALTAPPRPHELATQRAEVARLSRELAADARRRRTHLGRLRKAHRLVQLATATFIGGAVLLGGLAAAGAIPLR
jgi:hypothetical protein